MATTVTLTPNNPAASFGRGFLLWSRAIFDHEDVQSPGYLALVDEMRPDGFRFITHHTDPGTPSSPQLFMSDWQVLAAHCETSFAKASSSGDAGYRPFYHLGLNGGPASRPTTISPDTTTNIPSGVGPGGSPDTHLAWLQWWNARYQVKAYEPYNEPATNGDPSISSGGWYAASIGTRDSYRLAADWAFVHHRQYFQKIRTDTSLNGILVCGAAHSNPYDVSEITRFVNGYSGWPWTDKNTLYMDTLSFHAYTGGNGPSQNALNYFFYPSTAGGKNGLLAGGDAYRTVLNNNGGTNVKMSMSEWEPYGGGGILPGDGMTTVGCLGDFAIAIVCARRQAAWKLTHMIPMDMCSDPYATSSPTSGAGDLIISISGGTFSRLPRFVSARDMLIPFIKNYKRVLPTTISGSGLTPGGSNGNAISRVQGVAGLSDDGASLGILIANFDLTQGNDETVTIDFGTASAASITVKQILPSVLYTSGGTRLTGVSGGMSNFNGSANTLTVAGGANTMSFTLKAGEMRFITVPVASPGGGGGGGGGTGNAKASTLSDDFNNNTTDTAKWTDTVFGGGTIAEVNAEVEITMTAAGDGAQRRSVNLYDLTADSFVMQLPDFTGMTTAYFNVHPSGSDNDAAGVLYESSTGQIRAAYNLAGAGWVTFGTPVAYNKTTQGWFRLREASGTFFVEYAAATSAGSGPWTVLGSIAATSLFAMTAVQVRFGASL